MKCTFKIQRLLMLLRELYEEKCREVKWLISSKKYSPTVIERRQQEAEKLKEALEEITKFDPYGLVRLQAYGKLDEYLTNYTKAHPDLLGHNVIFGPDKPELFGYYSRIPWNFPITFFKS